MNLKPKQYIPNKKNKLIVEHKKLAQENKALKGGIVVLQKELERSKDVIQKMFSR